MDFLFYFHCELMFLSTNVPTKIDYMYLFNIWMLDFYLLIYSSTITSIYLTFF